MMSAHKFSLRCGLYLVAAMLIFVGYVICTAKAKSENFFNRNSNIRTHFSSEKD